MKVNIVGRHVQVTEQMEEHAREKFSKLSRFFAGIRHADVVMDVDGHGQAVTYTVEASVVLGQGAQLLGKAQADDMLAAIDLAESKLEKQIRRFHARLKDHRARQPRPVEGGAPPAAPEEATYEQVVREMLEEGEE